MPLAWVGFGMLVGGLVAFGCQGGLAVTCSGAGVALVGFVLCAAGSGSE